jgi:protein SCO1/2
VPVSPRRIALIAIAGALPLAVALGALLLRDTEASGAGYRGSRPPPGIVAPDFALRTHDGREVRMSALRGRAVAVTFLDTQCDEACPIVAAAIAQALTRLERADRSRVSALAISTDPAGDTRASVAAFLRRYRAEGALAYLTGPAAAVRQVWRRYGVLSSEATGSDTMHSAPVRVYAPGGEWVATLHAGADLTARNLAHDLHEALVSGAS